MKNLGVCILLITACCWLSCGTSSTQSDKKAEINRNENSEAYAFLQTFLNAKPSLQKQLSKALKPTKMDIDAIFIDTAIQNEAMNYVEDLFEKEKFSILLRKEHQDLEVWSASIDDFNNGKGDAIEFPSDFIRVIPFLRENLTFHRFKFKIKGYNSGVSYDGLTYVNSRWVIIPKAWKVTDNVGNQR